MDNKCNFKLQKKLPSGESIIIGCQRSAPYGGMCIGHDQNLSKDPQDFFLEITNTLKGTGAIADFTGFHFPGIPDGFFSGYETQKKLLFDYCTFNGRCPFIATIFKDDVSFLKAEFKFTSQFNKAEFKRTASFHSATFRFQNHSFAEATFHGEADFQDVTFIELVNFKKSIFFSHAIFGSEDKGKEDKGAKFQGGVSFDNAHFYWGAEFSNARFTENSSFKKTTFHDNPSAEASFSSAEFNKMSFEESEFLCSTHLDYGGTKNDLVSYLGADFNGVLFTRFALSNRYGQLESVRRWPMKETQFGVDRFIIRDQLVLETKIKSRQKRTINPIHVIDAYKHLEHFFYAKSDYSKAADCYVGQMVCRKYDPHYGIVSKFMNTLYRLFSNYGMSIWRPFFWIIMILLLLPSLLLCFGMAVPLDSKLQLPDALSYGNAFVSNVQLALFAGRNVLIIPSGVSSWLLVILEIPLLILLISFIVIASRRKFTPKKPLSED